MNMDPLEEEAMLELQAQIEWLELEKDHQLSMKEVKYDNIQSIIQFFFQMTEELKSEKEKNQVLTKEKENLRVSHQKELTMLKENQAKEMKDLRANHAKGTALGFERQVELHKSIEEAHQQIGQKIKERQEAEESHLCALEESKHSYEDIVEGLNARLKEEAEIAKEKQRDVRIQGESKVLDVYLDLSCKIQDERKAKMMFEFALGFTKKSHEKMKSKLDKQYCANKLLKDDNNQLMEELENAKKTIEVLENKREEQCRIISDLERDIKDLHESNPSSQKAFERTQLRLEKILYLWKKNKEDSKVKANNYELEIERLTRKLDEMNEHFSLTSKELTLAKNELDLIVAEQKRKLKGMDQALTAERKKVTDVDVLLHRIKGDLIDCAHFINDPKKLKETFMELHKRHIHENVKDDPIEHYDKQQKLCQSVLDNERKRWTKEMKLMDDRCVQLVKESSYFISQINDLREQKWLASVKGMNAQCDNNAVSSATLPGNSRKPGKPGVEEQRIPDQVKLPSINTTKMK